MNNNITPFKDVAAKYEAIIFDIWGVIYDGVDPYVGAVERINQLIAEGKKVVFLSNMPRPTSVARKNIEKWGINLNGSHIYTSGDSVREQMLLWDDEVFKNLGKKFYHLGAERNPDILEGLDVNVVNHLEDADFFLLTAYCDEGEDFAAYDQLLKQALLMNLSAVCANPDVFAQHGKFIRRCAGAFGKKYEEMGGIVHYYGKPHTRVFNKVINKFLPGISHDKILMVGDTLETDILGANKTGIDSLLLLTGNGKNYFTAKLPDNSHPFSQEKVIPTWVSDRLC